MKSGEIVVPRKIGNICPKWTENCLLIAADRSQFNFF